MNNYIYKKKHLFLFLGIIPFFFSCHHHQTIAPSHTEFDTTLVSPVSELVLPINFEVKELCAILNKEIDGTFLKSELKVDARGDSIYLEITKSAPLCLKWKMPFLEMDIPLHIEGRGDVKFGKGEIKNHKPITADILLKLRSKVDIGDNWKLKTKTTIQEIVWVKEPQLNILFIKVNLKNKLNQVIENKQDILTKHLDEQMAEKIHLKKAISKLWVDIQKPIRINKKEMDVWLQNRCDSIRGILVDKGPDIISMQLTCFSHPKIWLENDTNYSINKTLLPYKKSPKETENNLNLYILGSLPFANINKELNKRIKDFHFNYKTYWLQVKELEVYGTDSGLAVKANVHGTARGDLYFTGRLFFDSLTNTIRIKNFTFDVSTENMLLQSADWIFHSRLLENINQKLVLPLDSVIKKIPVLMVNGIEKSKVGDKMDVNVQINTVSLYKKVITKKDIQLIVHVTATGSIDLEKKAFTANLKTLKIRSKGK